MGRARQTWQEACLSALREPHPSKLPSRIECAVHALERRYVEWGENPGSRAELKAIRKAIAALEALTEVRLEEGILSLAGKGRATSGAQPGVAQQLDEAKRMFVVLRCSPSRGPDRPV